MIEIKNVRKTYSGRTVLDVKELKIEKDGRVALTGANGSGKSTLLKVLAGVIKYEGDVTMPDSILYMSQKTMCFDM
ncbi:MAG: ATP-binding cassette domain-containing protein, partial [Clostridia bacterium]|nr:ATP-binding cassette domain-containing protein [Clostridia bacterium]